MLTCFIKLSVLVKIFQIVSKRVRTCQNVIERVRTCQNVSERARMCQNVSVRVRTNKNMSECSRTYYQNYSEVFRISKDIFLPIAYCTVEYQYGCIFKNSRFCTEIDCDEVYPNLLIGNDGAAKETEYLKEVGVTHVLNVADTVDTDDKYYKPFGIQVKSIPLMDVPGTKISKHFQEIADYIHNSLTSGGIILVNCVMGKIF